MIRKMIREAFKSVVFMSVLASFLVACQEEEASSSEVIVTEVSAEDLPESAQVYIEDNFTGEVVTSTYSISGINAQYEALLTDGMNLIFDASGNLDAFGQDVSFVGCEEGSPVGWGGFRGPRGPRGGPREHFFGSDSSDSIVRSDYTALTIDDLPSGITDYLDANYADNEVLKILLIEGDDVTEYHILVEEVGALIFDAEGNFVELREAGGCVNFGGLDIEDLPAAVTDYVSTNYPDNEILRARFGTRDDIEEIHVLVSQVGVLIFDQEGNFIELKTCGMDRA